MPSPRVKIQDSNDSACSPEKVFEAKSLQLLQEGLGFHLRHIVRIISRLRLMSSARLHRCVPHGPFAQTAVCLTAPQQGEGSLSFADGLMSNENFFRDVMVVIKVIIWMIVVIILHGKSLREGPTDRRCNDTEQHFRTFASLPDADRVKQQCNV